MQQQESSVRLALSRVRQHQRRANDLYQFFKNEFESEAGKLAALSVLIELGIAEQELMEAK